MRNKLESTIKQLTHDEFINFKYHKKILFCSPLDDIISGYYFEFKSDYLYLWRFSLPIFLPIENITFTFGERINDPKTGAAIFKIDEDNFEFSLSSIKSIINKTKVDVCKMSEIEHFYNAYISDVNSYAKSKIMAYVSCYLKKEDGLLEKFIDNANAELENSEWVKDDLKSILILKQAIKDNKQLDLFYKWKSETLKKIGLSKYSN
ncbi:MAG: hypothetical protein IT215_07305 [Chitinophagaceae bacterium]|nr:hypothetical protein [Chitinophagaceae bacterium]